MIQYRYKWSMILAVVGKRPKKIQDLNGIWTRDLVKPVRLL